MIEVEFLYTKKEWVTGRRRFLLQSNTIKKLDLFILAIMVMMNVFFISTYGFHMLNGILCVFTVLFGGLVFMLYMVHPAYMKGGIGQRLLEYSIELAKKERMKSLRLDVYEKNDPAIRLYEKCGFRYVGTVDLGYGKYGLDGYHLYELILS